jgi:hypothetical protein
LNGETQNTCSELYEFCLNSDLEYISPKQRKKHCDRYKSRWTRVVRLIGNLLFWQNDRILAYLQIDNWNSSPYSSAC